jgi:splicing factor 3B subunit 4|eukprot:gene7984-8629_t
MSAAIEQRNQDATCYVGNLDEKVNEEILWELMLQAGPIVSVHMPKDKVSGKHLGYGFAEYRSEEDADYAIKVLNMIKVYGKPIKVNKASQDKKVIDIGANVFIGNLDPAVDEKLLYDTFSAFGGITQTPKIMLDPDTGASKGYAFISYDSFEASDLAIECMSGQYLCNRPIMVQYAFKKDTPGERHGTQAERLLAAQQPRGILPNTAFGAPADPNLGTANAMMAGAMPMVGAPGTALPPEYQYMQYAANPLLLQQMAMMGYGMPAPPPIPSMPTVPSMANPYAAGMVPPPPPPPPRV